MEMITVKNSRSDLRVIEDVSRQARNGWLYDGDVVLIGGIKVDLPLRRFLPKKHKNPRHIFHNNPDAYISVQYLPKEVQISFSAAAKKGLEDPNTLLQKLRQLRNARLDKIMDLIDEFLGGADSESSDSTTGDLPATTAPPPPSRFESDYTFIRPIGSGSYGVIDLVKNKVDGFEYAIKEVSTDFDKEGVLREVSALGLAQHTNVVRYYCAWMDSKKLYICMEFCCGGTLSKWLVTHKEDSEDEVKSILKQLAGAIGHIHSKNIIHRDLSDYNILMDENDIPKICDFGLAVILEDGKDTYPWENVGQALYKAPEVVTNRNPIVRKNLDIFALGLIFYQIICNHLHQESNWPSKSIFDHMRLGNFPESFDEETGTYAGLLRSMLEIDPADRIDAREVLSWLDEMITF